MQVRHIFVGNDLGDKISVARIALDQEKSERFKFFNNRAGQSAAVQRTEEQSVYRRGSADRDGLRGLQLWFHPAR